jgi:hypothetical protein
MPKKKKRYPILPVRIADATTLQQRVMEGEATAEETREYQRILRQLRRKYHNGNLSLKSARQFYIE